MAERVRVVYDSKFSKSFGNKPQIVSLINSYEDTNESLWWVGLCEKKQNKQQRMISENLYSIRVVITTFMMLFGIIF